MTAHVKHRLYMFLLESEGGGGEASQGGSGVVGDIGYFSVFHR